MKITLLFTGRTSLKWVQEGLADYNTRIRHYLPYEVVETPDIKAFSLPPLQLSLKEASQQMKYFDRVQDSVIFDERGKSMSSEGLASFFQQRMNSGTRELLLAVGGAYGFHESIKQKARYSISLSELTFPHQMVRLVVAEQIYRALSIIRNEKYHH